VKPYYEKDGITIFHGDCRDILPTLEPVDLVLTDPPYGIEAHTPMRRTRATIEGHRDSDVIPFASITQGQLTMLSTIPCNWLVSFCQAEQVKDYQDTLGAKYVRPMVWIKPDSAPQFIGDRPAMGYETIVTAWCSAERRMWNGKGRRGVFSVNVTDYKHCHPTQKPIVLMRELIELFCLGGTILDPFMGSGTTLRAAKDLGRKAIGIEIEEKYCEIAAKRLAQEVLTL
jgi:site-specific DNA-methyltransferase (adenine-specific)